MFNEIIIIEIKWDKNRKNEYRRKYIKKTIREINGNNKVKKDKWKINIIKHCDID